MRIAEIFLSIQGEGLLTGTESVFVRTSGCNLRCSFCDTPYASWLPEGDDLALDEIVAEVRRHACRHVVVTGGEPMLFAETVPLCEALRRQGHHITIETAGTLDLPVACDLMSVSPKLSNSTPDSERHPKWSARHERTRHAPQVIRRLTADYPYQLKFVVDTEGDVAEIETYLAEFPHVARERVLLMPQGIDADDLAERGRWLKPLCKSRGYRFCPRRQIEWFGAVRGT